MNRIGTDNRLFVVPGLKEYSSSGVTVKLRYFSPELAMTCILSSLVRSAPIARMIW